MGTTAHAQKLIDRPEAARGPNRRDHLVREEFRVDTEKRAQLALERSTICPVTAMDTYDFGYRKSIDREIGARR